jgi:predicted enzyme related to lactoylglutathione lyase
MFGWTKAEAEAMDMDMGPMGTYQLFATGGDPVGGMRPSPRRSPCLVGVTTSTSRASMPRRRASLRAAAKS